MGNVSSGITLWTGGKVGRGTGFPPRVIEAVLERSGGQCEASTIKCVGQGVELQHRRARGSGGTRRPETNYTSNALLVCRPCHHHIETNPVEAASNGWRVPQTYPPSVVPVKWFGKFVTFDDEGGVKPHPLDFSE